MHRNKPSRASTVAIRYLDWYNRCLAFLNSKVKLVIPNRYTTNEDARGAAALIQGYAARLGFGITG
jgi:hypothetical protein